MQVNLNGVSSATSSGPIPPGQYHVRVVDVTEKSNQVRLELQVLDAEFSGRLVWDSLFSTPKALPRLRLAAEALGFDCDGMVDLSAESLRGRECLVTVEDSEYDGRRTSKVSYDGYASLATGPNAVRKAAAGNNLVDAVRAKARQAAAPVESDEAPF